MADNHKKIVVLTSGGDAPGMNAALRAVVRVGCYYGADVFGCLGGYQGLIDGDIFQLFPDSVANIIQRGGTMLKTGRCHPFYEKSVRADCIKFLKKSAINHIVVIGGDGSFRGASLLHEEGGLHVIGIPATIDNDIHGTEYTLGFDTATNTALEAIDKIRDTASSHDRHFLVEVMGRRTGFLAVDVGIAGGAEFILTPEFPIPTEEIIEKIARRKRQKRSTTIVVAEASSKPGRSVEIAEELRQHGDFDFKVCILGHTQRGGCPTVFDRKVASQMGQLAVNALLEDKSNLMTARIKGELTLAPFPDIGIDSRRLTDHDLLELDKILAI